MGTFGEHASFIGTRMSGLIISDDWGRKTRWSNDFSVWWIERMHRKFPFRGAATTTTYLQPELSIFWKGELILPLMGDFMARVARVMMRRAVALWNWRCEVNYRQTLGQSYHSPRFEAIWVVIILDLNLNEIQVTQGVEHITWGFELWKGSSCTYKEGMYYLNEVVPLHSSTNFSATIRVSC